MTEKEIVAALRCISTAGGLADCEHCPYLMEEEVPEEERPIYGTDTWHSCDVDRVGLDGADLIEAQAKEIDALRNELRLKCGNYTLAHAGACDGCKWRDM